MATKNYIKIYLLAYERIYHDYRLTTTHVSLYFALLHYYNLSRFSKKFIVARSQLKTQSKIKSDGTYSKALSALVEFGYIRYLKSNSPHVGSLFSVVDLEDFSSSESEKSLDSSPSEIKPLKHDPSQILTKTSSENAIVASIGSSPIVQDLLPSKTKETSTLNDNINHSHDYSFSPPTLEQVKLFFTKEKSVASEAAKFYNHYTANGWKIVGKSSMVNWQASALNWITRSASFSSSVKLHNYLDSQEEKDYTIEF